MPSGSHELDTERYVLRPRIWHILNFQAGTEIWAAMTLLLADAWVWDFSCADDGDDVHV